MIRHCPRAGGGDALPQRAELHEGLSGRASYFGTTGDYANDRRIEWLCRGEQGIAMAHMLREPDLQHQSQSMCLLRRMIAIPGADDCRSSRLPYIWVPIMHWGLYAQPTSGCLGDAGFSAALHLLPERGANTGIDKADLESTPLYSSHTEISYAVFCLV